MYNFFLLFGTYILYYKAIIIVSGWVQPEAGWCAPLLPCSGQGMPRVPRTPQPGIPCDPIRWSTHAFPQQSGGDGEGGKGGMKQNAGKQIPALE